MDTAAQRRLLARASTCDAAACLESGDKRKSLALTRNDVKIRCGSGVCIAAAADLRLITFDKLTSPTQCRPSRGRKRRDCEPLVQPFCHNHSTLSVDTSKLRFKSQQPNQFSQCGNRVILHIAQRFGVSPQQAIHLRGQDWTCRHACAAATPNPGNLEPEVFRTDDVEAVRGNDITSSFLKPRTFSTRA